MNSEPETGPSAAPDDVPDVDARDASQGLAQEEVELRQQAGRVERLLEDVRTLAPRPVWDRVEELVQRLLRLYGTGLGRIMDHIQSSEGPAGPIAGRVAEDELCASLLLLHGLHPLPVRERVRRTLALARPELESQLGPFTLLGVDGDVARLRLEGSSSLGAWPLLSAESLLIRVLQDVAPEIARVELEGVKRPAAGGDSLVQIDLGRSRHSGAQGGQP